MLATQEALTVWILLPSHFFEESEEKMYFQLYRKKIIMIAVIIVLTLLLLGVLLSYTWVRVHLNYQPVSFADYLYQLKFDEVFVDQNAAIHTSGDVTIRTALRKKPNGATYYEDAVRCKNLLGTYYHSMKNTSYMYAIQTYDGFSGRFVAHVFDDFTLVYADASEELFDPEGKADIMHNIVDRKQFFTESAFPYVMYFILPPLEELPEDYYIGCEKFQLTSKIILEKWG